MLAHKVIICCCRQKTNPGLFTQFLHNYSQTSSQLPNKGESSSSWQTLYKFPYISLISALNKAKKYQIAATAFSIPVVYGLELGGQIDTNSSLVCAAVGVSGIISVMCFSYLSQNTVGFVYLDKTQSIARFSFVDFGGKRQEIETKLENIKPLSEFGEKQVKYYIPVVIKGSPKRLKLFHRHGLIADVIKFNGVF